MGTLIKSLSLNDNNMTSFFYSVSKTCRLRYNDSATNQKWARCLTDLSVQMFVVLLWGWREMTKLLLTPVSVFVSRNRRKANKDLVHSPTSRLRMRADSPVCSPERPLCLLYHWPFHIPQPAWEVGPHWLQHCMLCLNLALSLAGSCVSDWDMWTCARCIFILLRNAYGLFPCLQHLVESG